MMYEYLNIEESYEYSPSKESIEFLKLFARLYNPKKEEEN